MRSMLAGLLLAAWCMTGCASGPTEEAGAMKSISGKVWYRERMMLPPNAAIAVALQGVARMDAPAADVATVRLPATGAPPYPFTLQYDPARIRAQRRYVVRARIEADGRLLFTSTESIPAFDRDAPLDIMVTRVSSAARAPAGDAVSLTDTTWRLEEIRGHVAGAGAGKRPVTLTLASDGQRAAGFSGCNRYTGTFEVSDGHLKFSHMAGTRMACIEGMELEQQYLEALPQTVRYTIDGNHLALYSGAENLILRFVAANGD
jgi:putative lipoprotein